MVVSKVYWFLVYIEHNKITLGGSSLRMVNSKGYIIGDKLWGA